MISVLFRKEGILTESDKMIAYSTYHEEMKYNCYSKPMGGYLYINIISHVSRHPNSVWANRKSVTAKMIRISFRIKTALVTLKLVALVLLLLLPCVLTAPRRPQATPSWPPNHCSMSFPPAPIEQSCEYIPSTHVRCTCLALLGSMLWCYCHSWSSPKLLQIVDNS